MTGHVGEPVVVREGESAEQLRERVREVRRVYWQAGACCTVGMQYRLHAWAPRVSCYEHAGVSGYEHAA